MATVDIGGLLTDKDPSARMEIARRVGARLCAEDLPQVERHAAEALARSLVEDAIELVRGELSQALRQARHLSRDVAMKIAHDVDSVSCPFLEATEIFSEEDWQQLVLTISRGARISVARRSSMSESLAVSLAQIGDSVVAQTLVENHCAPMTPPVCAPLMERFQTSTYILDKLAERDDLQTEIVARLVTKVSDAARRKLATTYTLPDGGEALMSDAEITALLRVAADTPDARLAALARSLAQEGKLSFHLLLAALREGKARFSEAMIAELAHLPPATVMGVVQKGSDGHLTALLSRVSVPRHLYADIWDALQGMRRKGVHAVN